MLERREKELIHYNHTEIDKMIKEITKGELGKQLKRKQYDLYGALDMDEVYICENDSIMLYHHVTGYSSKHNTFHTTNIISYHGEVVYKCEDNIISCSHSEKKWLTELFKTYKEHLKRIEKRKYEQEKSIQITKVRSILNYIGKEGYSDDKIMIDQVECKTIFAPDWSFSKDEIIQNGRIRLIDGTVVMDTRQNIYHPGNWENYVCDLVDAFKKKIEEEQQLKKEKYDQSQKQKILEKKKIYEYNHSPIDDSKFFQ